MSPATSTEIPAECRGTNRCGSGPPAALVSLVVLSLAVTAACDLTDPQPFPASVEIVVSDSSRLYNGLPLLFLARGEEFELDAVVLDASGEPLASAPVVWSSSEPERVAVDQDGTLRGAASYMAVCSEIRMPGCSSAVEVRAGELVDSIRAVLRQPPADMVVEPADTTIMVGDTITLRTSLTVEGERFVPCTGYQVFSNDPAVVAIISGQEIRATGVGPGSAEISANVTSTYCYGVDNSRATARITVVSP